VIALATETPSLVIFGPPKLWPGVSAELFWISSRSPLTDDDGSSLGAESSRDSLGKNVNTLEHALPGIVSKHDILGGVASLGDGGRLEESGRSGESTAGSSEVEHVADLFYEEGGAVKMKTARRGEMTEGATGSKGKFGK
jgi:hypothetical protein